MVFNNYIPPIRILLIGMCTIFTKKPTNPIIKNPIPVARAILANSISTTRVRLIHLSSWRKKNTNLYDQALCISWLNMLNPDRTLWLVLRQEYWRLTYWINSIIYLTDGFLPRCRTFSPYKKTSISPKPSLFLLFRPIFLGILPKLDFRQFHICV